MALDVIAFLDRHGVPWSGPGANVSQGHVGIACFLCGNDPSFHLGINLKTGAWSCWRDDSHKGTNPIYLIQRLARKTRLEAEVIWSGDSVVKTNLRALANQLKISKRSEERPVPVRWGIDEFELNENPYLDRRFMAYLKTRGFSGPEWVAKEYGLRGALTGAYAHRLLFPLAVGGILYGWSGRAIAPSRIRYKTHPSGPQAGSLIYNYDQARQGGRVLVIVEGPVDALKVDVLGRGRGYRAIGLLGVHLKAGKRALVAKLAGHFDRLCVLLDPEALSVAIRLKAELGFLGKEVFLGRLAEGCEDPGALVSLGDVTLELSGS